MSTVGSSGRDEKDDEKQDGEQPKNKRQGAWKAVQRTKTEEDIRMRALRSSDSRQERKPLLVTTTTCTKTEGASFGGGVGWKMGEASSLKSSMIADNGFIRGRMATNIVLSSSSSSSTIDERGKEKIKEERKGRKGEKGGEKEELRKNGRKKEKRKKKKDKKGEKSEETEKDEKEEEEEEEKEEEEEEEEDEDEDEKEEEEVEKDEDEGKKEDEKEKKKEKTLEDGEKKEEERDEKTIKVEEEKEIENKKEKEKQEEKGKRKEGKKEVEDKDGVEENDEKVGKVEEEEDDEDEDEDEEEEDENYDEEYDDEDLDGDDDPFQIVIDDKKETDDREQVSVAVQDEKEEKGEKVKEVKEEKEEKEKKEKTREEEKEREKETKEEEKEEKERREEIEKVEGKQIAEEEKESGERENENGREAMERGEKKENSERKEESEEKKGKSEEESEEKSKEGEGEGMERKEKEKEEDGKKEDQNEKETEGKKEKSGYRSDGNTKQTRNQTRPMMMKSSSHQGGMRRNVKQNSVSPSWISSDVSTDLGGGTFCFSLGERGRGEEKRRVEGEKGALEGRERVGTSWFIGSSPQHVKPRDKDFRRRGSACAASAFKLKKEKSLPSKYPVQHSPPANEKRFFERLGTFLSPKRSAPRDAMGGAKSLVEHSDSSPLPEVRSPPKESAAAHSKATDKGKWRNVRSPKEGDSLFGSPSPGSREGYGGLRSPDGFGSPRLFFGSPNQKSRELSHRSQKREMKLSGSCLLNKSGEGKSPRSFRDSGFFSALTESPKKRRKKKKMRNSMIMSQRDNQFQEKEKEKEIMSDEEDDKRKTEIDRDDEGEESTSKKSKVHRNQSMSTLPLPPPDGSPSHSRSIYWSPKGRKKDKDMDKKKDEEGRERVGFGKKDSGSDRQSSVIKRGDSGWSLNNPLISPRGFTRRTPGVLSPRKTSERKETSFQEQPKRSSERREDREISFAKKMERIGSFSVNKGKDISSSTGDSILDEDERASGKEWGVGSGPLKYDVNRKDLPPLAPYDENKKKGKKKKKGPKRRGEDEELGGDEMNAEGWGSLLGRRRKSRPAGDGDFVEKGGGEDSGNHASKLKRKKWKTFDAGIGKVNRTEQNQSGISDLITKPRPLAPTDMCEFDFSEGVDLEITTPFLNTAKFKEKGKMKKFTFYQFKDSQGLEEEDDEFQQGLERRQRKGSFYQISRFSNDVPSSPLRLGSLAPSDTLLPTLPLQSSSSSISPPSSPSPSPPSSPSPSSSPQLSSQLAVSSPPRSSQKKTSQPLFYNKPDYFTESYSPNCQLNNMSLLLIDQDRYTPYFRHYFFNKEHSNFLAYDKEGNPLFVSVEKPTDPDSCLPVRAFVRTCLPWSCDSDADTWLLIPFTEVRNTRRALEIELESIIGPKGKLFELQNDTGAEALLIKAEDAMMTKSYKFGVLHCKKGQGGHQQKEEDIFGNEGISDDFQDFLEFLGSRIVLADWTGFRGGLDTKSNSTGTESVFTRFNDLDVMFHVGPLLPSGEGDQHLGKKRHIGNDIVVIIFKDEDATEPLDPSIFVSDFNHIFTVVQKVSEKELEQLERDGALTDYTKGKTYYRIGFCSKEGVHSSEPGVPCPGIFEKNEKLHRFFMTKLINSERSALYADKFVTKLLKTRIAIFRDIGEDLIKLVKKEKSSGWQLRIK